MGIVIYQAGSPLTQGFYTLAVTYLDGTSGSFGPFVYRETAEACALTLARRDDVVGVTIYTATP